MLIFIFCSHLLNTTFNAFVLFTATITIYFKKAYLYKFYITKKHFLNLPKGNREEQIYLRQKTVKYAQTHEIKSQITSYLDV